MKVNTANLLSVKVDAWYARLQSVGTLTERDCYDLKEHLLDTIDELKDSGLNDEEAFEAAAVRLGKDFNFQGEYARVNEDTFLIRKVLLIFAGVISYFLFYFLMIGATRTIFYYLSDIVKNPQITYRYILFFLAGYHLIFPAMTLFLYKSGKKLISLKIRPVHLIILVMIVFALALTDFQLQELIRAKLSIRYITISHYFSTFDYSGYTLPLVIILCYLAVIRKSRMSFFGEVLDNEQHPVEETGAEISLNGKANQKEMILIALFGILVYMMLHYLFRGTSQIFLTILQHFKNDPERNFGWVRWYIATVHLIVIFFTTSLYIKDNNLIDILKNLSVRSLKIRLVFFITILLAIIDRLFLAIARNSLHNIIELKIRFGTIIRYSDISFSFLLLICFVILFEKYYRENMRTY